MVVPSLSRSSDLHSGSRNTASAKTRLMCRTHSGMGAALLSTPDILLNILRNLLDQIPLPISCKIRLLPEQPATLYLVSKILRTGIRNLTVHCRTRNMRPSERAQWERLGELVALGKERGVSMTCNGDGDGWTNWDQIRQETGAFCIWLKSLEGG